MHIQEEAVGCFKVMLNGGIVSSLKEEEDYHDVLIHAYVQAVVRQSVFEFVHEICH